MKIFFFSVRKKKKTENCEDNDQIPGIQMGTNKWTFNTDSSLVSDKLSGSYITCSLSIPVNATVVAILYQPSQTQLDDDFGDMPCK